MIHGSAGLPVSPPWTLLGGALGAVSNVPERPSEQHGPTPSSKKDCDIAKRGEQNLLLWQVFRENPTADAMDKKCKFQD